MKPKNFFSTWARQRNAIWGEVVPDICATASVAASYDNMEIDSYASNPAPSTVENPGEESGAGPGDSTSELSASVKKLTVVDSQSARCSERASEEIPVKRVGPAHAVQVSSESWTHTYTAPIVKVDSNNAIAAGLNNSSKVLCCVPQKEVLRHGEVLRESEDDERSSRSNENCRSFGSE